MAILQFETFYREVEFVESQIRPVVGTKFIFENADAKKRAAFCMYIDSEIFTLFCFLHTPRKPEECTYKILKEKLDQQYGVKNCIKSHSQKLNIMISNH